MKVEYGFGSLQNCQCGGCPVHDGSRCIVEKTEGMKYAVCGSDPRPEQVEAIYCSVQKGRSGCSDLATSKACMCPTCTVWKSHDLETAYYCVSGAAS